jgi:tetratricopeptide (TPR) repeat protein
MNISNPENLGGKFPPNLSNDALEALRAHVRHAGKVEMGPVTWNRLAKARQFVRLAIDLRQDGRSLTSGRYAKRALSLFARESRIDDYDAIVARLCLADSRVMRRDFTRAETDYQDGLSSIGRLIAARRSFDVRNLRAHALRGLANVALAHGKPLEAERQLLQALDRAERKPGSSHKSDATMMDDLGTLYRQTGRYQEASRMLHLALSVIKETVGIEHPQAATILEHLAMLEHARGRFTVGERFAREAAAIQRRVYGPDHPRVATALVVLALMLEGRGKCLEATETRQVARLIAQHWFGDDLDALAESGLITATTHSRSDHRNAERVPA